MAELSERTPNVLPDLPVTQEIKVLLVDDDAEFAQLVDEYLAAEGGFAVTARGDGEAGARSALTGTFDVILLDVGLPKQNGFSVLKLIREQIGTPVIMLTARGDDLDRILGLEIGADDYLAKPCNLRELAARIRAILRRTRGGSSGDGQTESGRAIIGDLTVETGSRSVYRDGKLITLTGAEYLVLDALLAQAGDVVDKGAIAKHALGRRLQPYDRSVDVHVGHLRKKLGPLSDGRQRIKTVRGRGYLYVVLS
ncbi:MAG: response regulator transcription factor [Pseudomonadota bacterium]